MNNHHITSLLSALLLASLRTLHAAEPAKPQTKPNILFAIADDWSCGYVGAYDCKWIRTPAMDRVAREGILFTRSDTPNGKCAPSRASIITGRNPWQLKAAGNHWPILPPEFKSMLGKGHIYDEYPYGNAAMRNYYNRIMGGEKITE